MTYNIHLKTERMRFIGWSNQHLQRLPPLPSSHSVPYTDYKSTRGSGISDNQILRPCQQGRIQDFAQGWVRDIKYIHYTTWLAYNPAKRGSFFGGPPSPPELDPTPPINIIRIITLGKTRIKKWSEPLRNKEYKFCDLDKNYRTS